MQVLVRDNKVDQALRVLKKKMQREGVFREMKRRRFFTRSLPKRRHGNGTKRSGEPASSRARRPSARDLSPLPKERKCRPADPPGGRHSRAPADLHACRDAEIVALIVIRGDGHRDAECHAERASGRVPNLGGPIEHQFPQCSNGSPSKLALHLLLGSVLRANNANGIAKCGW